MGRVTSRETGFWDGAGSPPLLLTEYTSTLVIRSTMRVSWVMSRAFIASHKFFARSLDFVESFTRALYLERSTARTTSVAVVTAAARPTTTSSTRTKAA